MSDNYSVLQDHIGMLLDDVRNAAYESAINSCVDNNSVVLDLGAGLGLHGLMAARAGARKVYLVDPSPVLKDTAKVVVENNLSDRIELFNKPIEVAEIKEKVDVIISVLTGNFLVEEDLLPSLFLARDRWLKPGGTMIPDRASMLVVPVSFSQSNESPGHRLAKDIFDLDYSVLRQRAANQVAFGRFSAEKYLPLGPEMVLQELNLLEANSHQIDQSVVLQVNTPGVLTGVLGWMDLGLGEAVLSTGPDARPVHWSQAYFPLAEPLSVKEGDQVRFRLRRPEYGDWTWTMELDGQRQRLSSFLGRSFTREQLAASATKATPRLSADGEAALFVLEMMAAQSSVEEIVEALLGSDLCHVPDERSAQLFVGSLIERFSC